MRDKASLRLLNLAAYSGPSVHADRPAIRLDIELTPAADTRAAEIDGLFEFLAKALALPLKLFEIRLADADLPHLIGNLALTLHGAVLPTANWFTVRREDGDNIVRIVYSHSDPLLGAIAGRTAVAWVGAFLPGPQSEVRATVSPQQARAQFFADTAPCHLGANGKLIVAEAMRRGIPWRRVIAGDMTVRLGQGFRQKWLCETLIGGQSKLGNDIVTKKHLANKLLSIAGLPVPRQIPVSNLGSAIQAAELIGYPVVLKPASTDRGVGVHVGLRDDMALRKAFVDISRHGLVLVEQHIPGTDFRILVLDGRVLAATRRAPASVVGDGRQTIRQLIDDENRSPRRVDGYVAHLLQRIPVDDDLLNQLRIQELSLESVPAMGTAVRLHGAANLSMGGVPVDVTGEMHPDNRSMAVRAARILGLEMAGVDFLTRDISRSFREVGGGICEVNSIPGLRVHVAAPGSPDVVSAVVDHLFPGGGDGRIPIVAITGTNGKTTTSRMVASMFEEAGHCVGLATTDGVTIDRAEVASFDLAGAPGAAMVLHDPAVTAAVLETARGGLIRNGMAFDRCDVAAVLNVTDDHLGFDGVRTRKDMAAIKSTVAKAAQRAVVLNADDPLCVAMGDVARAKTLWWFSEDPTNEVVCAHVARGQPAITLADRNGDRMIVAWSDGVSRNLMSVADIPCTFAGRAEFNVANAMAAIAIGLAMDLGDSAVNRALSTFAADETRSSGRCNFVEGWPFRILVDYAHNPAGVKALCRFLSTEPVNGRRWLVLTSFGNRLDSHFHKVAAAAAGSFDRYICTSNGPRNRSVAEIAGLLSHGLRISGVDPASIFQASSEEEAVERATAEAREGDLLVVLSANATSLMRKLEQLRQRGLPNAGGVSRPAVGPTKQVRAGD